MKPEELFIRQSVAYARSLPLPHSVDYLKGLLFLCGDNDITHPVREVFIQLSRCDSQLELIATGQMELPISEPPAAAPSPSTPPTGDGPSPRI